VRTLVLKSRGALAPYRLPNAEGIPATFKDHDGYWTGFSARIRVIVYNTNPVKPGDAQKSIYDLTEPKWKGQIAIADQRFWENVGLSNDGKGQPSQTNAMSHGCAPTLFRRINVLRTE